MVNLYHFVGLVFVYMYMYMYMYTYAHYVLYNQAYFADSIFKVR